MSKEWIDYQKHGEVVKDPYIAHHRKTNAVTPQHETGVVTQQHETKVVTPQHETRVTKNRWPLVWASGGSVPAFSHLREPKHARGISHYPKFQRSINLCYEIHNFRVYVTDNEYFQSRFPPIKLSDWKNKCFMRTL
jgi:hypothetical protein